MLDIAAAYDARADRVKAAEAPKAIARKRCSAPPRMRLR
jgi:hypothetical protein